MDETTRVAIPFKDMNGEDLHIGDTVLCAMSVNEIAKGVIVSTTPKNIRIQLNPKRYNGLILKASHTVYRLDV